MKSWAGYILTLLLTVVGIYLLSDLDFFPVPEKVVILEDTPSSPTVSCSLKPEHRVSLLLPARRRRRSSMIWDEMGESDAFREIWNLTVASRDFRHEKDVQATAAVVAATRMSLQSTTGNRSSLTLDKSPVKADIETGDDVEEYIL